MMHLIFACDSRQWAKEMGPGEAELVINCSLSVSNLYDEEPTGSLLCQTASVVWKKMISLFSVRFLAIPLL